MDTSSCSQESQCPNLIEEEQLLLQSIIERLETVYSDFVSESEALWSGQKQATEEACQSVVSDTQRDLETLQEARAQGRVFDQQFEFAIQYVTNIGAQFGRK